MQTAESTERSAAEDAKRAVLVARDLTKTYHAGTVDIHALDGVDLELYESELVVLVGPSGSGKSSRQPCER